MEALMEKNDRREGGDLESDRSDWSAMASSRAKPTHPLVMRSQLFDIFDKDGSGAINPSEVAAVLEELRVEMTAEEVEQLMKDADLDGNGVIDFAEFEALLSKARASSGLGAVIVENGLFGGLLGMFGGGGGGGGGGDGKRGGDGQAQSSGQRQSARLHDRPSRYEA